MGQGGATDPAAFCEPLQFFPLFFFLFLLLRTGHNQKLWKIHLTSTTFFAKSFGSDCLGGRKGKNISAPQFFFLTVRGFSQLSVPAKRCPLCTHNKDFKGAVTQKSHLRLQMVCCKIIHTGLRVEAFSANIHSFRGGGSGVRVKLLPWTKKKKRTMLPMHKIRILWYQGIKVLD